MRIKNDVKGQKRNNLKELRRTEKDRRLGEKAEDGESLED